MTHVYFLPGMMCDQQLWQQVWEYLPAEWQLHYLPIEQCADRTAMKMLIQEQLSLHKGHVVGFSMGGYLALEYALEQPHSLTTLTMVGASAFGLPADERERRQRYLPLLEQNSYVGISRHRLAQFVHPQRLDDPLVGGIVRAMDARLGKETLIRQIRSVSARESYLEDLPQLALPVQLIGGENDRIIRPSSLHAMVERLPDARLTLLADTGHMLPLEQPQAVAQLLQQFITPR